MPHTTGCYVCVFIDRSLISTHLHGHGKRPTGLVGFCMFRGGPMYTSHVVHDYVRCHIQLGAMFVSLSIGL